MVVVSGGAGDVVWAFVCVCVHARRCVWLVLRDCVCLRVVALHCL